MKVCNTSVRLKSIMQERNLKQVDILRMSEPYCRKYNVRLNKNDLSQYVSGKVEPGQSKLFILGKTLNVSEAWLMGFDVPRTNISLDSITNIISLPETKPEPEELKENEIIIRGRDGSCVRKILTPEQIQAFKTMVDSLPDAPDDI